MPLRDDEIVEIVEIVDSKLKAVLKDIEKKIAKATEKPTVTVKPTPVAKPKPK